MTDEKKPYADGDLRALLEANSKFEHGFEYEPLPVSGVIKR